MFGSVFVLYLTSDLELGPTMVGVIFATGGAGAVVGAPITSRISSAQGIGRSIVVARLGPGVSGLLIPVALFVPAWDAWLVAAVEFMQFVMLGVYAVSAMSLRRALTPPAHQGRVNAAFRFFSLGMPPFGSLLGGILGGFGWTHADNDYRASQDFFGAHFARRVRHRIRQVHPAS